MHPPTRSIWLAGIPDASSWARTQATKIDVWLGVARPPDEGGLESVRRPPHRPRRRRPRCTARSLRTATRAPPCPHARAAGPSDRRCWRRCSANPSGSPPRPSPLDRRSTPARSRRSSPRRPPGQGWSTCCQIASASVSRSNVVGGDDPIAVDLPNANQGRRIVATHGRQQAQVLRRRDRGGRPNAGRGSWSRSVLR